MEVFGAPCIIYTKMSASKSVSFLCFFNVTFSRFFILEDIVVSVKIVLIFYLLKQLNIVGNVRQKNLCLRAYL